LWPFYSPSISEDQRGMLKDTKQESTGAKETRKKMLKYEENKKIMNKGQIENTVN
jgi:hypothetical protein